MKQAIITLIIALFAESSWAQERPFSLTIPINIPELEGKRVYLTDIAAELPDENNSIFGIIENGKVDISGSISQPTMKMLFIEKKRVRGVLVESGEIVADSNLEYFTGSPLNDAFTELQKEESRLQEESIDSFQNELKAFITKHNNDLAGMMALGVYHNMLSVEDRLSLVSSCGEVIKESIVIKKDIELWKNEYLTRPGQKYVDLELITSDNKKRLSDYIGKGQYVLANFWAPWCRFSREEIPNLIKYYSEYKDKGLSIIGIACGDMEASKKVVDEFSIPYPQMYTSNSNVESIYGIDKYPEIILFSPDGTIVDRWLRGDNLTELLERTFK